MNCKLLHATAAVIAVFAIAAPAIARPYHHWHRHYYQPGYVYAPPPVVYAPPPPPPIYAGPSLNIVIPLGRR